MYGRLVRSIAPSIWELDDVKKGVLCQLFGGTMQGSMKPVSTNETGDSGNEVNQAGKRKDATTSHQRFVFLSVSSDNPF